MLFLRALPRERQEKRSGAAGDGPPSPRRSLFWT